MYTKITKFCKMETFIQVGMNKELIFQSIN